MTRDELLNALELRLTGENKDSINEIRELIRRFPENFNFSKFPHAQMVLRPSTMENEGEILHTFYEELREWIKKNPTEEVKTAAIHNRRESRKGFIIFEIVLLVVLAVAVIVLGTLSAFEIVDTIWCTIIGNVDCALGIIFFAYELGSDKLIESRISSGDEKSIEKYVGINHSKIKAGKNSEVVGVQNIYRSYPDDER